MHIAGQCVLIAYTCAEIKKPYRKGIAMKNQHALLFFAACLTAHFFVSAGEKSPTVIEKSFFDVEGFIQGHKNLSPQEKIEMQTLCLRIHSVLVGCKVKK
jgi:hypothetical protein